MRKYIYSDWLVDWNTQPLVECFNKNEKGIGLKEIENVTDQRGFINKTENCKL